MGESGWKRTQCLKMDNIFFRCFAFLPIYIASSIYANIRPKSQWHQRATHIGADPSPLEAHFEIWVNANNFLYLCHPPIQAKIVDLQEYDSKNIVGELYQVAVDHRRLVEVISCHLFGVEMIRVVIDSEFSEVDLTLGCPSALAGLLLSEEGFCSTIRLSVTVVWYFETQQKIILGGCITIRSLSMTLVCQVECLVRYWQMNKLAKLGYALAISNLKLSVTLSLDRGNC